MKNGTSGNGAMGAPEVSSPGCPRGATREGGLSSFLTCVGIALALSGCVNPDAAYAIIVINETSDEIHVNVELVNQTNDSLVFSKNLTVPGDSFARIREELPALSSENRHYRIEASTRSGLSGWTAVQGTCGLCTDEIHVGNDQLWFTNSVS